MLKINPETGLLEMEKENLFNPTDSMKVVTGILQKKKKHDQSRKLKI